MAHRDIKPENLLLDEYGLQSRFVLSQTPTGTAFPSLISREPQSSKSIASCTSSAVSLSSLIVAHFVIGNLKLTDFGLATVYVNHGKERMLETKCGTPPYVAPELFQGRQYSGLLVDLWSCGIVLVALLVGSKFLAF